MKKLFLIAAALGVFASCAKESGTGNQSEPAGKAVVNFAYVNDTSGFTRGDYDQIEDDIAQSAVSISGDIHVILAAGDDIMRASTISATGTTQFTTDKYGNELTTSIDRVIALANLPDGADDIISAATSVEALTTALSTSLTVAQTQYLATASKTLWVQGETEIATGDWTKENDGLSVFDAEMSMYPVISRIDVKVSLSAVTGGIFKNVAALQAANGTSKQNGIVLDGVAVLYSASASSLITPYTPNTATGTVLTSGITPTDLKANSSLYGQGVASSEESFLHAEWNGTAWNITANNPNSTAAGASNYVEKSGNSDVWQKGEFRRTFYAFSPNNYAKGDADISDDADYKAHTIVTVYGKMYDYQGNAIKKADNNTEDAIYYWSFHFNDEDMADVTGHEKYLEPGKRYLVSLNFHGDFNNGGGGSIDPDEPLTQGAQVNVEIKPATWAAFVEVGTDFNKPTP